MITKDTSRSSFGAHRFRFRTYPPSHHRCHCLAVTVNQENSFQVIVRLSVPAHLRCSSRLDETFFAWTFCESGPWFWRKKIHRAARFFRT